VIEGSLAAGLDVRVRFPAQLEVTNTSITEWRIDDDTWRLVRYNDHAHLADL
jgi:hypothetical protein